MPNKPPVIRLRYQPLAAGAAQIALRTGAEPAQAEWTGAAMIAQEQWPVLLSGRPVAAEHLPFLRMHFGRSVGWIATDQVWCLMDQTEDGGLIIGRSERTFAFTGQPNDWRWRLPDDFDGGEPLVADMDALDRILGPAPASPEPRDKGGREPVYDWEYACACAWEWRERHGYPDGELIELQNFIADRLEARHGRRPDLSNVAKHLRGWTRLHPTDGKSQ